MAAALKEAEKAKNLGNAAVGSAPRMPRRVPSNSRQSRARSAAGFGNVGQSYKDCPGAKVRPTDHILYAVKHYWACRLQQHLFGVV
jgi:hypothetical protein